MTLRVLEAIEESYVLRLILRAQELLSQRRRAEVLSNLRDNLQLTLHILFWRQNHKDHLRHRLIDSFKIDTTFTNTHEDHRRFQALNPTVRNSNRILQTRRAHSFTVMQTLCSTQSD